MQRAVHGGAGDAKQVLKLADGVLTLVVQPGKVLLLPWVQLRLLAAQPATHLRERTRLPLPALPRF